MPDWMAAGPLQRVRYILLPMSSSQLFFVLFLNISGSFRCFAQIKLLTNGGPANGTKNLIYYIYENAIINGRFETACVQAMFLFLLILILTGVQFALEKKTSILSIIKRTVPEIIKMLLGLLFIAPLLIGILFSFQSEQELGTYPLHLLSNAPTLQNYMEVIKAVPLFSYLLNSGIVCLVSIATQIVIACLAAYGFVFFEFPLKKLLFSLVLMTTMIPGEVVVITNYTTIQSLHLTNTYAGLVVTSLISGTSIFLMRQFFMTIPKDYKEAAVLDGCGEMRFLFHIILPMSKPTISSMAVYLFVQIYNQFFWPLLVTNTEKMRTIQIGISMLVTGDVVNYGHILAGAVIAIIPAMMIYIIGQDYMIRGMTSGGVKG